MLAVLCLAYLLTFAVAEKIGDPTHSPACEPPEDWNATGDVDKCTFLKLYCHEESVLQYMQYYYCSMSMFNFNLLFIPWLGFMSCLLAETADFFFVDGVKTYLDVLKAPPLLLGVTLLPLGNGAVNVFASIVAFKTGEAWLGFSSLAGSGFFITTCILSMVVLSAPDDMSPIKIEKWPFLRDVCFYIFGVFYTITSLWDNTTDLFGTCMWLITYLVYICVVIYSTKMSGGEMASVASEHNAGIDTHEYNTFHDDSEPVMSINDNNPEVRLLDSNEVADQSGTCGRVIQDFRQQFGTFMANFRKASVLMKFVKIVTAPFVLLRIWSVPLMEVHHWNKYNSIISMFLCPPIITFALEQHIVWALPIYVVTLPVAIYTMCYTSNDARPDSTVLCTILSTIGLFMSVIWIYMFACEMVGLLLAWGIIYSIKTSYIGFTVTAWATAFSDLFANLSLTRQGYPEMAVAACIAGPMFNMLLGLFSAMLYGIITTDGSVYEIDPVNGEGILATFAVVLLSLGFTLTWVSCAGFKMSRMYGKALPVVFICGLIWATINIFDPVIPGVYPTDTSSSSSSSSSLLSSS